MKFTEEQLNKLGFRKSNEDRFYYNEHWEYQFNPYNNDLTYYNEGFGDDEPLVRIRDLEHFKQVLEVL